MDAIASGNAESAEASLETVAEYDLGLWDAFGTTAPELGKVSLPLFTYLRLNLVLGAAYACGVRFRAIAPEAERGMVASHLTMTC